MMEADMHTSQYCLCGSGKVFERCCGRFLSGQQVAKTPEQLMRSRYSAYALGGYGAYLLATWFAPMTTGLDEVSLSQRQTRWTGLEILDRWQKGDDATVTFIARYEEPGGHVGSMHEKSVFKRIQGRWLYVGKET